VSQKKKEEKKKNVGPRQEGEHPSGELQGQVFEQRRAKPQRTQYLDRLQTGFVHTVPHTNGLIEATTQHHRV
jgi:hypothetical protein